MSARRLVLALWAAALAACGGGGGGGAQPVPPPPPPPPSLGVTLAPASAALTVLEDETEATFSFTATVQNPPAAAYVVDLLLNPAGQSPWVVFASDLVETAPHAYTITARTYADLPVGGYDAPVRVRLCTEPTCAQVLAGSTATFRLDLTVARREWAMFQRDARHTGFVNVELDPADFAKAWEWTSPDPFALTPATPAAGAVYVSTTSGATFSLRESDGAVNWSRTPPRRPSGIGAAAFHNGVVYLPFLAGPVGSVQTDVGEVLGLDAATGMLLSTSPFHTQVGVYNAPTIAGGDLYVAAGEFGDELSRYALPSGDVVWVGSSNGSRIGGGGAAAAVDDARAYVPTGDGLAVFDKADGALLGQTDIIVNGSVSYGAYVAPVLSAYGHVIVNDQFAGGQLAAFDVDGTELWRTGSGYAAQPVLVDQTLYVARNTGAGQEIAALSLVTGAELWATPAPPSQSGVDGPMVATARHLFFSTNDATYALDLDTRQVVWSTPASGALSISSGLVLYIAYQRYADDGVRLTAIRLAD